MRTMLILTPLFLILIGSMPKKTESAQPPVDKDVATVSEANNAFAIDLYKQLVKETEPTENILISPYSINAALAMTYAGALGTTAEEMAKVLYYQLPQNQVPAAQAALAKKLSHEGTEGKPELHIANSLWPDDGFPLKPEFEQLTTRYFGSGIHVVDYSKTKEATDAINAWVSEQTRDMIPKLLNDNDLIPETVLCLVNAIYFKGEWTTPFETSETKDGIFQLSKGKSIEVPLMNDEDRRFKLYRNDNFQYKTAGFDDAEAAEVHNSNPPKNSFRLAVLPYRGDSQSMILLVPNAIDGLPALEKQLTAKDLAKWIKAAKPCEGWVRMPRFKSKARFYMVETLQAMGMKQLFAAGADLSGIAQGCPPVGIVIHEAKIEVDEIGTKAAAATLIGQDIGIRVRPIIQADRPFLYMIYDHPTETILFIGRLTQP